MNLSSRILRNTFYIAALAFSAVSVSASAETLLSANKKATASTKDNSSRVASKAVDGSTGTRWSSYPIDNSWITLDLGKTYNISRVKLNWEAAYGKGYQIQTSNDGKKWTNIYSTTSGDGGIDDLNVSGMGRYVRMNGTERGTSWGYSLWEFEVFGSEINTTGTTNPPSSSAAKVTAPTSSLLSKNKAATASTKDNKSRTADKAVDGSTGTRWSSYPVDSSWFVVDLGKTFNIDRVKLNWEAAFGKGYKIQVSNDGSKWNDVYSTTTGNGGTDDLSVSGNGRYVRMLGTARGTTHGYSLWEFEVYGTDSTGSGSVSSSSSSSSSSTAKSSSSSSSAPKSSSSSSAPKSSSSSAKSSSSSSKSSTPSTGGVTLEWFIPDARENGEYLELSEIGGYELRYKKSTDTEYTTIVIEDGSVDSYTLNKLSGDYEFSIAAFDTNGLFSEFVAVEPRS